MTFFTLLIITYLIDDKEMQSHLVYTSPEACSDAMMDVKAKLDPKLTIDMIQCVETTVASYVPRPMPRPDRKDNG